MEKEQKLEVLNNNKIFQLLTDKEKENVISLMHIRNYPKNTFIFWQSEDILKAYFIQKGLVKIFRSYQDKKMRTLGLLKENDLISDLTLFLPYKHFFTAQVLTDSTIICLPIKELSEIISNNSMAKMKLEKRIQEKIENALHEVDDSIFKSIHGNLALKLSSLADKFGVKKEDGILIKLKFSQQELADMIGTNRETICKTLNNFKIEKSIIIKDKLIKIIDRKKLLKWQ